jgi:hypothetical protein
VSNRQVLRFGTTETSAAEQAAPGFPLARE